MRTRGRRSALRFAGFAAWLSLSPAPAAADTTRPPAPRWEHITRDDGLSHNEVNTIVEDPVGFMWFGTADGLNRFDGYDFTIYRNDHRDPRSLSQNAVRALLVDRHDSLWIGTESGLNRFDRATDDFVRYRSDPDSPGSLSNDLIYTLYEDREGTVWVGTHYGLNRLHRAGDSFTHVAVDEESPERGLSSPHVQVVTGGEAGELWLGTINGGLNRYDPRTGVFTHHRTRQGDPNSLSDDDVQAILVTGDGTLWVGTSNGLNRFVAENETFVRYLFDADDPTGISSNHIESLLEDDQGRLWIGTDGGGINLYRPESDSFLHYRHDPAESTSLETDVTRSLYQDRQGNLWVGNFAGGVHFYNPDNAVFSYRRHHAGDPNSLSHSAVLSFFEDDADILWVGTEGGLNRFDRRRGSFRRYQHDPKDPRSLSANAVLTVLRDSRGDLWAGTFFGGLNRLSEEDGRFVHYRPEADDPYSLSSPHVWDLLEDRAGQLWIATFYGINRFDPETSRFVHYPHDPDDESSVGHHQVWSLFEDSSGTFWAATQTGLSRYDREEDHFHTYRHDPRVDSSLSSSHVYVLFEDSSGILWVGTSGGGLNRFDPETEMFRAYRTADGLASDVIYGILEDDRGQLWLSTNGGISRFDPRTERFTNFDKSNGLLAEPFARKAAFRSRTGEMFFGGNNGFNSFFPQEVRENSYRPPIVLTDFQIFNKPVTIGEGTGPLRRHISIADEIRLSHRQSVISFRFAALSYRSPERNRYAYLLEGFDAEWQDVGARRTATYTNLDPGEYTFRVKGANNSGLWNEEGTSVRVVVTPPFWATWWFRSLSLATGLLLMAAVYRARTRQITTHNAALEAEITERKHVEADLEARNAELERFTYTVSHDLKAPLVTIKGFLSLLQQDAANEDSERLQRDIQQIGTAADTMARLLNELLELSRAGRKMRRPEPVDLSEVAREASDLVAQAIAERDVKVEIAAGMPTVPGDRVRLLEVFLNLIENAVKFMGDQPDAQIEISASERNGVALCSVRDNGIGIAEPHREIIFDLFEQLTPGEEGSGVGLALVRRILEAHGGRIWVDSPGERMGSTFFFTLPSHGESGPSVDD